MGRVAAEIPANLVRSNPAIKLAQSFLMYSPELLRLGIAESSIVGKKWKQSKVSPQSEVISDGAYHKALFECLYYSV